MYPLKATAAQVLGFAGTENTGLAGMEMLYDKELSGKAGSETIVRDPAGHTLKTIAQQEPVSGQDVRLTLDSDIQYYAEDVLRKTVRDTGGQAADRHRDGPAHRRGPGHGQRDARGVPWLRQGPRRPIRTVPWTDLLRAGLDLQAGRRSPALWPTASVTPTQQFNVPPSIHVADREVHDSHLHGVENYSVREIIQ